ERGVLLGEQAVGARDPRPDVSDGECRMPQHERLVALGVARRAVGGPRRGRLLVVSIMAGGFVPVPLGAGQRIRPRRRRQRVFDTRQLPHTVALHIEQHRRPREVEGAGGDARGREHRRVEVHEVIAVARLHPAHLHEAVGPGARDVLVWLGSAANLGHDLIGRAWMVGPGRHGAQHQAGERDVQAEAHGRSIHEARVYERVHSFVYWGDVHDRPGAHLYAGPVRAYSPARGAAERAGGEPGAPARGGVLDPDGGHGDAGGHDRLDVGADQGSERRHRRRRAQPGAVRIAFTAGSVARTDVLSAESQLAGDRTLLPPLLQQLSVARHALSVLVGKTPAEWSPPDFELETLTLPDELPVTVPSELVRRRPDILAGEAQLHAAGAAIGVATAQLYPSVTISPSWVLQAIGGPVAAPSILGSIAGDIVAPIFHGGALKAQQRAAVDAYESELGVYRQTLLVAFGQVADILRALQHDAELLGSETAAVTASKASLALAQDAYAAGRGSLVQVLDAQRLYAQALLGYARAKGQRYL